MLDMPSNQTKANQAKPNQTKPSQAKPLAVLFNLQLGSGGFHTILNGICLKVNIIACLFVCLGFMTYQPLFIQINSSISNNSL